MARNKLTLPDKFSFSAFIPIRITDINYGGHVGNDSILALLHEARMHFLKSAGYTEMEFGGVSLIMADAVIEFKGEAFYGDVVKACVAADEFSRIGFALYYRLAKEKDESVVAIAKTGMVCFDYTKRKVVSLPNDAIDKLRG